MQDAHGATATATLNITVGAQNDAPVITAPASVTIDEDTTFTFTGAPTQYRSPTSTRAPILLSVWYPVTGGTVDYFPLPGFRESSR